MRILLLGETGQVGYELRSLLRPDRAAAPPFACELVTTARTGTPDLLLDTTDLESLRATLDRTEPDIIINATAYTAVDQAESEPELAARVNAEVPAAIGHWAARRGSVVIHYSTDYVFDGTKTSPYLETDEPNPVSVYGQTKLAGDQALLDSGCDALILRVSWVYGTRGRNFLLTMQRLMQAGTPLRIVDDQVGAPTWCRMIAATTRDLIDQGLRHGRHSIPAGVYNCTPAGQTTWYGFASAIARLTGSTSKLTPIATQDYPTPAARPANSRLDNGRLTALLGRSMPTWETCLGSCLRQTESNQE